MRGAGLARKGPWSRADVERALAAHLCRCTGWQTIHEAFDARAGAGPATPTAGPVGARPAARRDLDAATRRATLEGGTRQTVGAAVPLGEGGFAADTAPPGALVAVPTGAGTPSGRTEAAAGSVWSIGSSPAEARAGAGIVQGRHSTVGSTVPLDLPPLPPGGVRLATSWVEPAYLETDASWCEPGGDPASPLSNGGAFGGKAASVAPEAARELAERLGRPVTVLLSREDAVRLGPKRPPVAAAAVAEGRRVRIAGSWVAPGPAAVLPAPRPAYHLTINASWTAAGVAGPPVSTALRAAGVAEHAVLVEGALDEAALPRDDLVDDGAADVLLDTCVVVGTGARAGARVSIDPATGDVTGVEVRVAGGDPLDWVVMRSYAIGAVHMALGWVFTEGVAVDPGGGSVHDLTVRSFGVIRARAMPPVDVTIVDGTGPPRGRSSDAVFAAVAAAAWNAAARADGSRAERFPAREARAARALDR